MKPMQRRPHQDVRLALTPVQDINRAVVEMFEAMSAVEDDRVGVAMRLSSHEIRAFREAIAVPRLRELLASARVPIFAVEVDSVSLAALTQANRAAGRGLIGAPAVEDRGLSRVISSFNQVALSEIARTCAVEPYLGTLCFGISERLSLSMKAASYRDLLTVASYPVAAVRPKLSPSMCLTLKRLADVLDEHVLSLILGCMSEPHEVLHLERVNDLPLPTKRMQEVVSAHWNLTRLIHEMSIEGDNCEAPEALLGLGQMRTKISMIRRAHGQAPDAASPSRKGTYKAWMRDLGQTMSVTATALSVTRLHRGGMSFAESVLFAHQHHRSCIIPGPVSRDEYRFGDFVTRVALPMSTGRLQYSRDARPGVSLVNLSTTEYSARARGDSAVVFLTGLAPYLASADALRRGLAGSSCHVQRPQPGLSEDGGELTASRPPVESKGLVADGRFAA